MYVFGIGLHKVSLGTLILALGLLVDDAIIAVETMAVKLEQASVACERPPSPTAVPRSLCSRVRWSPCQDFCRSRWRNPEPANTRAPF